MSFIKQVLATVVGIMVFFAIMTIFFVISIVGMALSGSGKASIDDNSVFVIELSGQLTERAELDPLNTFLGKGTQSLALDEVVANIKKAKQNKDIKGIYLNCGAFSPDSYASLEEIRRQLLDFKKSGKWIVAYGDEYTTDTYYLASTADKVLIHESGMLDWHGLSATPMFFKEALAKFGIKVTLSKVGTYKSAPETFTADGMSEANREQVTAYITGTWNNIVADISQSRGITETKLNEYADSLIVFSDPKMYVSTKMIDQLVQRTDVKQIVKQMLKIDSDDDINTVSMATMTALDDVEKGGEEIAVYYAYGDIVDEMAEGLSTKTQIVGDKVADDLIELANNDDVKAVVLRVNSGGGSAFASEKMFQAMKKLKAKKPVVVSMGGMAASGGYYMSCLSNWIVAEKTTLTGSIGIFGMFPDFSELLTQKLGVKFDVVKTNALSDFGTISRPFSAEEMALLNKYIERGYDQFLSRVSEGRKMQKDAVDNVAQGRVWLGQDAIKKALVDQIGGIDAAIDKAAKLAKLDKFHQKSYPEKEDFSLEKFLNKEQNSILDGQLKATLGEFYPMFMLVKNIDKQDKIQARMPYVLNIK